MEIAGARETTEPDEPRKATPEETKPEGPFWQRLLHRWFVEYNPLYLVSALLVLSGLITLNAHTAAETNSAHAITAIAEVYAFALIASAALLVRIGLRRPAVMLSLILVLYQGFLMLLTETQVYLGTAGAMAGAVSLALFVAKIHGLAWAMRVRLSRSAVAVPVFGAVGLSIMPPALLSMTRSEGTTAVAVWVFALFAGGLFSSREITSKVSLDAWGQTVFARTKKAIWILWATLFTLHVLFWSSELRVSSGVLVPVALLLATRWMRGEASVWAATASALFYTGVSEPGSLSVVSVLAAATLALRAFRKPARIERAAEPPSDTTPYRASGSETPPPEVVFAFVRSDRAAMLRLLCGSMVGVYLSMWTFGFHGGALPQHVLLLDVALAAVAAVMAYRPRARAMLGAAAMTWLHAAVQAGIVTAPRNGLQWGVALVGAGFVVLLGSLAIAWKLRGVEARVDIPAR